MFENYNDIMTASEVAKEMHVSRNHIYDLLKEGQLHGHQEGRVWKIPKIALIDYVMSKGQVSKEAFSSYTPGM